MRICRLSAIACLLVLGASCRSVATVPVDQSVTVLVRGVTDNDGQALWNHLPPTMKAQLRDLLRSIRGQLHPPLVTVGDRLVAEAAEALTRQASRLPQYAPLREGMKASADRQAFAEGLASTLHHLAPGILRASEGSEQAILDRAGPPLMKMLVPALRASGSPLLDAWKPGPYRLTALAPGKIRYARDAGAGQTVSEVLVQIDGRWIPERWATAWQQVVTGGQGLVQAGRDSPLSAHTVQIVRLVNQTRARLNKLIQAGDQAAFDEAMSLVAGSLGLALIWASTPTQG